MGLCFCARALSSCGKWGPLFIAVRGPLSIAASLAAEHRLQTRRPSNCGSRAQPLRGTRDPLGPGLEPVSPALAGGFLTTAPPGKPHNSPFKVHKSMIFSIVTELCNCHYNLILQHFLSLHPLPKPPYSLVVTPKAHLPPSPTTNLLSISMDLSILDISCKWSIQYEVFLKSVSCG